ncbi:MAG: glycoside hydrolase family 15 protein [Candidatus Saccharimonadales bacterium]
MSYDLWEEKFLTTTYTTATVIRALRRASSFADQFGYPDDAVQWMQVADSIESSLPLLYDPDRQAYRKGLLRLPDGNLQFDNTLDMSTLYGLTMFTKVKLNDPTVVHTVEADRK